MAFSIDIAGIGKKALDQVENQLPARAIRGSNELRNAALEVLRGARSGRRYGRHVASAPGEPPAVKSGALRLSWRPVQYGARHESPAIESSIPYAGYMDNGTPGGLIAPRPFADKIVEKAEPQVTAIYAEPFDLSF